MATRWAFFGRRVCVAAIGDGTWALGPDGPDGPDGPGQKDIEPYLGVSENRQNP